jgi:hypothetical protein
MIWALLGASAAGCAAREHVSADRFIASQASIRAAEDHGASEVPRAARHLRLAREGVQAAKRLSAQGEGERARLMLMRAQVDAELALSIAREEQAERLAIEALREVEAIGAELR